jgi:YidC/Oxa1 family membrane protein insertase
MVAVAWLMVQFHKLLTLLGLGSGSGVTWALSIVGLVIIIRILLIPLFMRQIKAARGMQMLSPELQALQKKYKGRNDPASREAMTRETMDLYKKHGTNPFSSCLPILAQSPIFFALFRVLNELGRVARGDYPRPNIGPLTQELAIEANAATIFEAPISSSFLMEGATTQTKVVAVVLIALMSLTTFTTQKQLTQKNMPASALQGPMAQQQKMLLYILPLVFAISGVNFPLGVLIYWSTTNLWSMGQQFYVIRRNPTPGSEADRLLKERRARRAAKRGIVLEEEKPAEPEKPKGQRQQPVRKDRARTRPPGGTRPAADGQTGRPASAAGRGSTGTRGAATGSAAGTAGAKRPVSGATGSGKSGAAPSRPGAASGKSGAAGSGRKASPRRPGGSGSTGAAAPGASTGGARPGGGASTTPSAAAPGTPSGAARKPRTPKQSAGGSGGPGRPAPASDASGEATPQTPQDTEAQDER